MGRARLDPEAGRFDEAIVTWNDLREHDPKTDDHCSRPR
jgi:hypothetical protein